MDFFKAEMIQTGPNLMLELLNAATHPPPPISDVNEILMCWSQLEATRQYHHIDGLPGTRAGNHLPAYAGCFGAHDRNRQRQNENRDRDDESKMA